MSKTVTSSFPTLPGCALTERFTLHGPRGRKYINRIELVNVLRVATHVSQRNGLLTRIIAMTGARVSEVLSIAPAHCQVSECIIAFITLKRRRYAIREVPVPRSLMQDLEVEFGLREAQRDPTRANRPIWRLHRASVYRLVHDIMLRAGVSGAPASPRGLRHGFGVNTLQSGVPITLVQRWMGHARLSTTAIYLEVSGPEERFFATRFWDWGSGSPQDRRAA